MKTPKITNHTSLSGIAQVVLKGILLAEGKMSTCVYASLFGDEVGYLWQQLARVPTPTRNSVAGCALLLNDWSLILLGGNNEVTRRFSGVLT